MQLTVRKYRNVKGDKKQIADKVSSDFVPLISKIDGFVDYYCFFAADGTLLTVSAFRDAKGAEESVRLAAKFVEQNLASMISEKPEVMSGDVVAYRHLEKQKAA